MSGSVLLVNSNVVRPPVSPIGLEYAAEALVEAGLPVRILDLVFEHDWKAALARVVNEEEPSVVGLGVRNTDDCSFATGRSFLPWISELVAEVRRLTASFVVLGGVGFSVVPEAVLGVTGADAGVAGDAEETLPALVRRLMNGDDYSHLPNLVYRRAKDIIRTPRVYADLTRLPARHRSLIDNRRYEEEGAQVGVETKRGCPNQCIFCADPVARGNVVRLRPPAAVAEEFRNLLSQGVSWFHTCDSEFNIPLVHAKDVCRAIVERGLGSRLHWYAYCSPVPFDRELAVLMKRAGCAGVNFGVDSLCDEQLNRLGRGHTVGDVEQLVAILEENGLDYMFDLLVGAPGETPETVRTTIDTMRRLDVPLAGIAAGVRVYPGTPLGHAVTEGTIGEGLHPASPSGLHQPVFYLSPGLGSDAFGLVHDLVSGDERFLFLASPSDAGSYNYADDEGLSRLIEDGARGAYWDIIRRNRQSRP